MNLKTSTLALCLLLTPAVQAQNADELFAAALAGKPDRLASLLAQGTDVNARTAGGRTALMAACFNGNVRAVKVLLGYGADVNAADNQGTTALMDALVFGDQEIVSLLLAAGANVNAFDNQRVTVLARAKKTPHKELVPMLERAGAIEKITFDPNATEPGEATIQAAPADGGTSQNNAEKTQNNEH